MKIKAPKNKTRPVDKIRKPVAPPTIVHKDKRSDGPQICPACQGRGCSKCDGEGVV